MYILLFLMIFTVMYVYSFKDDFKKEQIDKVAPILAVTAFVALALCILTSLTRR